MHHGWVILLPKPVKPLVQEIAHGRDLFRRPVESGSFAAVVDACEQLLGILDEALRFAVQKVAVPAGDACVTGCAVFLMYTARIERLHASHPGEGKRDEQNADLPRLHVQEKEPDLD